MRTPDLTSHTFERWTVLGRAPKGKGSDARWLCQCACGTIRPVLGKHLRKGISLSCGCLHHERLSQRLTTHGLSHRSEFRIWQGIIQRCLNPKNPGYANYGGRGITMCDRWLESFEHFYEDMGPRPSPKHSLDRYPDPDGPYTPENTRWATRQQQQRNHRGNHRITIHGITKCLIEWLEHMYISQATYHTRLARGWSIEEAIMTPVKKKYGPRNPMP